MDNTAQFTPRGAILYEKYSTIFAFDPPTQNSLLASYSVCSKDTLQSVITRLVATDF